MLVLPLLGHFSSNFFFIIVFFWKNIKKGKKKQSTNIYILKILNSQIIRIVAKLSKKNQGIFSFQKPKLSWSFFQKKLFYLSFVI